MKIKLLLLWQTSEAMNALAVNGIDPDEIRLYRMEQGHDLIVKIWLEYTI